MTRLAQATTNGAGAFSLTVPPGVVWLRAMRNCSTVWGEVRVDLAATATADALLPWGTILWPGQNDFWEFTLGSSLSVYFNTFGAGWPPDTNGDVGPNHYIQTVNTSVGIYDKDTGTRLVGVDFDTFFTGAAGTPCDNSNQGDVVALYDASVDRWVVTDFAWFNPNTGPFYECIAVSQTGDPVAGCWGERTTIFALACSW